MKKRTLVALLCMLVLVATVFAGCGTTSSATPAPTQAAAEKYTVGLGTFKYVTKSKDVSVDDAKKDVDGLAETDVYMFAVTFDSKDTVVAVSIDSLQSKINFDKTGKITSDLTVAPQTKRELGDKYGMGKVSKVGEWYKQANALEKWMKGKTYAQIVAMKTKKSADGKKNLADEADLVSTCTVGIDPFLASFKNAYESRK